MVDRSGPTVEAPRTLRGEQFLNYLRARVTDPWSRPRPIDARHASLVADIECQSSASKLALIEAATSTIRSDEVYLEVGSFTGATTIAAARARADVTVVAIDNFSQFGGPRDQFLENVTRYGVRDRVKLIEADFRGVLAGELPPVGVYFFDGPHGYDDQYVALELAMTHLADQALVIVDDTNWRHVRRANRDFVVSHPRLSLLCDLPSASEGDATWWNGIQVFEYVPSPESGARTARYYITRARYLVLPPFPLRTLWRRLRLIRRTRG